MSRFLGLFSIAAVALMGACTQTGQTPGGEPVVLDTPKVYFVVQTATAYVQPTTDTEVAHAVTGKTHSNVKGNLLRGSRVDVTKIQGTFVYGEWELGANGWLSMLDLIPGEGGTVATTVEPMDRRDRPDSEEIAGEIAAGTLLIVLEQEGPLSRVNYDGKNDGWVETGTLSSENADVGISRLIEKMRYSAQTDEIIGPAYEYVQHAEERYPNSSLLELIQDRGAEHRIAFDKKRQARKAAPATP